MFDGGKFGGQDTRLYGIGIDEPIVRYEGDTPIYYHANSLGSIIALTDSAGDIVESYRYSGDSIQN